MSEQKVFKVLMADPVGFVDVTGKGVEAEVREYIESNGAHFHTGPASEHQDELAKGVHFFYAPALSAEAIVAESQAADYDMVNLAAKTVREAAKFPKGGVRWGAGTNNFPEQQWKGAGVPIMNVPAGNSTRTAASWAQGLLHVCTQLDIAKLHNRVMTDHTFTTDPGINEYPTLGLAEKRLTVLGAGGAIACEVRRIAQAFRMEVNGWINYGAELSNADRLQDERRLGIPISGDLIEAVRDTDVITPHIPLIPGVTEHIIDGDVMRAAKPGFAITNYARGPLVEPNAMEEMLQSGQLGMVIADVDVERDNDMNLVPGAAATPYMEAAERFPGRVWVMPHIATDTDHYTRVGLVKRGVDQTLAVLLENKVINANRIGGVPEAYQDGGTVKPPIGPVSNDEIVGAVARDVSFVQALGLLAQQAVESPEDAGPKLVDLLSVVRHSEGIGSVMGRVQRG